MPFIARIGANRIQIVEVVQIVEPKFGLFGIAPVMRLAYLSGLV